MKTILHLSALLFLLFAVPSQSFALMSLAMVSKERAKEMGLVIETKPSGPDAVWIALEFEAKGELKNFNRATLDLREGEKYLVSTSLHQDRSKPGRIAVSLTASRAHLDKITLTL